jgi:hypothetical protein
MREERPPAHFHYNYLTVLSVRDTKITTSHHSLSRQETPPAHFHDLGTVAYYWQRWQL